MIMRNQKNRPLRVLLVEDNPADAELTREALQENHLSVDLSIVSDGVKAVDFLHRRGAFARARRPDIIVLDLNLPRLHGKEVLASVRAAAELRVVPVVVLTSSAADQDVRESYELGANCYVTKPLELHSFQDIVRTLEAFWFNVVRLPPHDENGEAA